MGRVFHSILIGFIFTSLNAIAQTCPTTAKEWDDWRTKLISGLSSSRGLTIYDIGQLNSCAGDPKNTVIFTNPQFVACMKPLRDWATTTAGGDDNLSLTNEQYIDSSRVAFPEVIAAPQEVRTMNLKDGPTVIEQLSQMRTKYPGLQAIKRSENNIIVWIPGADFDRWINISAGAPGSFLYIGIQKRNKKHQVIDPPKSFFNSYQVGGGPLLFNPHKADRSNCVDCHRTGAMPVLEHTDSDHALAAAFPGEDVAAVQKTLIDEITKTATAVPDSIKQVGIGPPMGDVSLERLDEFMQSCSKGAGKFSMKELGQIRNAMDCASCHDSYTAGVLNAPFGLQKGLMKGIVEHGHMPPHADKPGQPNSLTFAQSRALYACLRKEYYGGDDGKITGSGELAKWILRKKCPTQVSAPESINHSQKRDPNFPKNGSSDPAVAPTGEAVIGD